MFGARADNLKMALGHRVKININPLLGTFYNKFSTNKSTSRNNNVSKEGLKFTGVSPQVYSPDTSTTLSSSFEQMMAIRQDQAQRSILVKLNSIKSLNDLEHNCRRFDQILKILPYTTMNDKIFALVEFHSIRGVHGINSMHFQSPMKEVVHVYSPIISLKDPYQTTMKELQAAINNRIIHPYIRFTPCTAKHLREQLQFIKTVPNQMILLNKMLSITDLDVRLRFYTAAQISYYVSKLFPNVSVIPFGSSVTGFGQLGCDLDLLCRVETENSENERNKFSSLGQHFCLDDRNSQIEFLEFMDIIMKKCMPGITSVKKIMEARVPIIKFFNKFTNMHCDLSSSNMVALNMSELLYTYSLMDPRVKPVVFTIRKWARNSGVTREVAGPWITNFALTLLIIFYLQTKSILPSLNVIKHFAGGHKSNASSSNSNWLTKWRNSMPYKNTENLHVILYGFFEYYSLFDFGTHAICVREAKIKSKRDNSPLYIYNPLEMTLNVSKNVQQIELNRTVDRIRNALQTLVNVEESGAITNLLNIVPSKGLVERQKAKTSILDMDKTASEILNSDNGVNSKRNETLIDESLLANNAVINTAESIIK